MKHLRSLHLAIAAATLALSGCLIEHETAITPDAKVDPRLEGVWRIADTRQPVHQANEDPNDIGLGGYIIISKVSESTYKCVAYDSFEEDEDVKLPDMLISTKNHQDHRYLLVRLAKHEIEKDKREGKKSFKNWTLDYEIEKDGTLSVRFLYGDNFKRIQDAHPMAFEHSKEPFSPITLKGSEKELLEFYSDPKVRALLTSCGRYEKLDVLKK